MRFGARDFGYSFVASDDDLDTAPAAASTTATKKSDDPLRRSSPAGDESLRPYVYTSTRKLGGGGGAGLSTTRGATDDELGNNNNIDGGAAGSGGAALVASLSEMGVCCCCLCAMLVVVGGVLLAFSTFIDTDDDSGGTGDDGSSKGNKLTFVGSIVLVVAAASFILGFCSCCFSCVAACARDGGGGDDGEDGGGLGLFGSIGGGSGGNGGDDRDVKVQFRRLNDRYQKVEDALNKVHLNVIGDMEEVKVAQKKEEKARKDEEKRKQKELKERVQKDLEAGLTTRNMRRNYRPIAFFIRFDGDTMLTNSMDLLRKQVSIIVNCGRAGVDRAVVEVTSPGGSVSAYGLAASQLVRVRKAGIQLIVCVDTVAASGGYMMASVGDTICAAPFAIIGSIGVVTQIPNVQRFLNKHDIDAYLFTAGKHKRTVDIIGDVTDEGKAKLQEELNDMHRAFKDHVALARPALRETIDTVATGEYWVAVQAKEHGLVDEIMTSDEYLESISRENEIIEIVEKKKKKSIWSTIDSSARAMKSSIEGMALPHQRQGRPMAAMP